MSDAEGAEKQNEFRDMNRDGIPDYLETPEYKEPDDEIDPKDDLNQNGVPDHMESNPANDDQAIDDHAIDYDAASHRNSPLKRADREATETIAATAPAGDKGTVPPFPQKDVDKAAAIAADQTRKNEANPKKLDVSKGENAKRLAKLKKKAVRQKGTWGVLGNIPVNKSDAESGLEVGRQIWKGLAVGLRAAMEDTAEKKRAEREEERRKLEQAEREADKKVNDAVDAAEKAETIRPGAAADAKEPSIEGEGGKGGEGGSEPGAGGATAEATEATSTAPEASSSEVPAPANDAPPANDVEAPMVSGVAPATATPAVAPTIAATAPSQEGSAKSEAKAEQPALSAKDKTSAIPSKTEIKGADVTGNAGLGMAVATVNPAAGVAIAAVQSDQAQTEAGQSHREPKKTEAPATQKAPTGKPQVTVSVRHNGRSLAVSPMGEGSRRDPSHAPKPVNFDRPPPAAANRKGPLFDQARAVKLPQKPVLSVGPTNPAPRIRAVGLGSGLSAFSLAARALSPRDNNIDMQITFQKNARDSGGQER